MAWTRRRALGRALAAAGALALAMGMASVPEEAVLTGNVVFRERMALPPGAEAHVKLVDVSRADAPAIVIAETRVPAGPGSPIPYALRYDPKRIEPRMTYALEARIEAGGALMFINTERHAIFSGAGDTTEILVRRVSAEQAPASPVGAWIAEDIGGRGVIDTAQSTLEITAEGRAFGSGACNRFTGEVTIKDGTIAFSRMAGTMMACPPAIMDQEQKFHAALSAAKTFSVDGATRKLTLFGADGAAVMVLAAQ